MCWSLSFFLYIPLKNPTRCIRCAASRCTLHNTLCPRADRVDINISGTPCTGSSTRGNGLGKQDHTSQPQQFDWSSLNAACTVLCCSIAVWVYSPSILYCRWRNPWTIEYLYTHDVLTRDVYGHVCTLVIPSYQMFWQQHSRNRHCTFIAPSAGLRLVHFNSCDAKLKILENVVTGEAGKVTEECFPNDNFDVRKIVTNPSDPWHAFLVLSKLVRCTVLYCSYCDFKYCTVL